MSLDFDEDVWMFISLAQKHNVKMLMVGGGAVNFYGYQRHSADVDFWIDTTPSNLVALRDALNELGYEFDDFPEDVKRGQQNISIKISPVIDIELITSFNPGRSFPECYEQRYTATNTVNGQTFSYEVIAFNDLINSKIKAGRPKDLYDIIELRKIQENKNYRYNSTFSFTSSCANLSLYIFLFIKEVRKYCKLCTCSGRLGHNLDRLYFRE